MQLLPTTILTPSDWIAEVIPQDRNRKPFRCGVSPHLSEEDAWENVVKVLRYRGITKARIYLKRRHETNAYMKAATERVEARGKYCDDDC